MDDRLEEDGLGGYVFYVHSLYPLHVEIDETLAFINITVKKFYKGHVTKKLTRSCRKIGYVTEEQRREIILDVIEIFLRKV